MIYLFLRYIYIYDMKDDKGLYYPTIHGVSLISCFKDSIQPGFHGDGMQELLPDDVVEAAKRSPQSRSDVPGIQKKSLDLYGSVMDPW